MKFRLAKTSLHNTDAEKEKYEKLGFVFRRTVEKDFAKPERRWRDIIFQKGVVPFMEVENLDALMELVKKWGGISIYNDFFGRDTIDIADDYL